MGIGKGRGKYLLNKVSVSPFHSPPLRGGDGGEGDTIYDSKTKTLRSFTRESPEFPIDLDSPFTSHLSRLTLNFLTPTRIVYDGHFIFDLEFHMLIRQLLRRISLLSYFHCGGDPSGVDFRGIIEEAKEVRVKERNFRWYDWERYSARQDERMKMGGFVGEVTFEGNIEPFMPLIKAGG